MFFRRFRRFFRTFRNYFRRSKSAFDSLSRMRDNTSFSCKHFYNF